MGIHVQLEDKLRETLIGLDEIKVVILEALEQLRRTESSCPPCPTTKKKKEKTPQIRKSISPGT